MPKTTVTMTDAQEVVQPQMDKLHEKANTQMSPSDKPSHETGFKRSACETPALLDVDGVAGLLTCSTRHVYRLADAGRMPRPVKLGALSRWPRTAVLDWVAEGCPAIKTARRPGGAA